MPTKQVVRQSNLYLKNDFWLLLKCITFHFYEFTAANSFRCYYDKVYNYAPWLLLIKNVKLDFFYFIILTGIEEYRLN